MQPSFFRMTPKHYTIYDEISRRFKLINRLYIKNAKDEAEARQVIDTIKGKKVEIYWMKEIPNNA